MAVDRLAKFLDSAQNVVVLEDLPKLCRNALHTGSISLGHARKRDLATMTVDMVWPRGSGFVRVHDGMKVEARVHQYFVGFAKGAFYNAMWQVFGVVANTVKMRRIGFALDFQNHDQPPSQLRKLPMEEWGARPHISLTRC